ncbi:yod1 deubiquitinase [Arctopsyche grandis]|uniref:yod1 deubiquitinase n=1 Tax=Arctopsyche grandis TaxID=121162 RepID=UPI00406D7993
MTGFSVRVRSAGGQVEVGALQPGSSVAELVAAAARCLQTSPATLTLLAGFPPRPLPTAPPTITIAECGVRPGDTLVAETAPAPAPAPATARAPPPDVSGLVGRSPLIKHVVPSDNSCLFTSVGFVTSGKVDTSIAPYLRKVIAEAVAGDRINYCEAFLGKPNAEYCDWIQKPNSWGGAIEISVLSTFYGIEIDVVNVLNAVVNKFGEDKDYGQRVFLLFDGIHYDPLYSEKPEGSIQTIFPIEDDEILQDAEQLSKSSHPYTDVNNFQTKCLVCDAVLIGLKSANQHTIETSHTMFSEI